MNLIRRSALKNCVLIVTSANMSDHVTFEMLNFDNLALRTLPIEKETDNYVRQVKGACFSKVYIHHYINSKNYSI